MTVSADPRARGYSRWRWFLGLLTVLAVLSVLGGGVVGAEAQVPPRPIPTAGLRKATRIPAALGPWTRETVLYKPFAATSPWNTPIPPGARFTRTNTFAGDSGFMTSTKNSTPVWFAGPGDPVLTFSVVRPGRTALFRVRGPAHLQPAADADLQLTLVDLANLQVWDFFGVARTGPTTFRATAYGTGSLNGTGFGYFPAGGGTRVRAGVRASGASWLGGLVTGENVAAGAIDHALAIGASNDDLYPAFVPPAVEFDANGASTYRGTLSMGTRIGIPRVTPVPPGLSPIGAMIFRALSTYGGYVVDRNAGFNLFADARTVPESMLIPVRRPGYGTTGSDLQKIVPLVQIVG